MKTTHKQKVKLANKMRTPTEKKNRESIWLTKGWLDRKLAIKEKINAKRKTKV